MVFAPSKAMVEGSGSWAWLTGEFGSTEEVGQGQLILAPKLPGDIRYEISLPGVFGY